MSRPLRTATVTRLATIVLLAALVCAAPAEPPPPSAAAAEAEAPPAGPTSPQREAEDAIRRALSQPVTVEFYETPLEDVAAFLQELSGIPIFLDGSALADYVIPADTPRTFRASDITLRSVLRLMLRDLDFTYVIRDEVVMITSLDAAETPSMMRGRIYAVGDIIACRGPDDEVDYDFDSLIDLITTCVGPAKWEDGWPQVPSIDLGGAHAVAVWQTEEMHEEIASLLAALRTIAGQTAEGKIPEAILYHRLWPEPPAYESIRKGLSRTVSVEVQDAPLMDIVDHLAEVSGLHILVDARALEDVGVAVQSFVTIRVTDAPVKAALRQALAEAELTYVVRDEVVLMTVPEEAETRMTIGIYPVADLVGRPGESEGFVYDYDLLRELISLRVPPASWAMAGGPGTITPATFQNIDALVIGQTPDVHEQIADFLARLRITTRQFEEKRADPIALLKELLPETPFHRPAPAALSKKVTFDFDEVPLSDVADFITKTCGIRCLFSATALEEMGIDTQAPVSLRVSGITLRSALNVILRDFRLTWVVDDGTLLIMTPDEAEKYLTLEIYRVADLVTFRDENGELWEDYDSLINVIARNVAPRTWHGYGGYGGYGGDGGIISATFGGAKLLLIRQTDQMHEKIAELLQDLRNLAADARDGGEPPLRRRFGGGGFF